MKINTLETLLVHELKDLYHAEKQLVRALPKMAKAAHNDELRHCFEEHLEETQGQIERLEQCFDHLGQRASGVRCEAMEGLVQEGKSIIDEDAPEDVKDAGLICAAQKVEHYEIAGYGCARTFAELLGQDEVTRLLQETLDEEAAADQKLTEIAMSSVNQAAMAV